MAAWKAPCTKITVHWSLLHVFLATSEKLPVFVFGVVLIYVMLADDGSILLHAQEKPISDTKIWKKICVYLSLMYIYIYNYIYTYFTYTHTHAYPCTQPMRMNKAISYRSRCP